MRLELGKEVPLFNLVDIHGNEVNLEQYRGSKVMISFYRFATCPFCNLRVHKLMHLTDQYEASGLKMISFWQSTPEHLKEHIGDKKMPFPMVADYKKLVYEQYGVEKSWKGTMSLMIKDMKLVSEVMKHSKLSSTRMNGDMNLVPADFLINPDLTLYEAYYGEHIGDHIPFEHIGKFINQ